MSQIGRRSLWLRYGTAIVVTFAALVLKLALVRWATRDQPALLFFAAVMVSAAFGGFGPGLVATLLGTLFDAYFFMEPFNRFRLNSPDQVLRLGIFIGEGVFVSIICARMKAAQRLAEKNAAEAQELEGQVLQISDAEQRRIGHDLHDGLSQHLTGIGLLARTLQETVDKDAPSAAEDASRLCDLSKAAIEWTRDLSRSLLPPTLSSAGLADALEELASNAQGIFRIECTFEQTGEASHTIDVTTAVHLYRITQEAISNAVRHGRAQHVCVKLEQSDGGATLRIIDDGCGIDATAGSSAGLGLRIMRYRARTIGASIDITSRDGGGTVVTCRYPLPGGGITNGTSWTSTSPPQPQRAPVSLLLKTTPSSARD